MANDRFYIVCDGCKQYRWLDDWHPGSPLYLSENRRKSLNDFFEQHWDCTGKEFTESVGFYFGNETTVLSKGYKEHKYIEDDTVQIKCLRCGIVISISACDKPDDSLKTYCMDCMKLAEEKEND
ncbi:MAG: hypothetical protein ACYSSI_00065 [Planctomycetota bacterium]|jgi:tRNA(Ile)-lysidine synthase TilS/MesJ